MQFERRDRQKALRHTYYEFWMLKRLGERLQQETADTFNKINEKSPDCDSEAPVLAVNSTSPPAKVTVILDIARDRVKGSSLPDYMNDEDSLVQHNAIIEAFAIHARGLLDFLYYDYEGYSPRATDVVAKHYFEKENDWLAIRPQKSRDEVNSLRERVGRQVAHLTYYRSDIQPKDNEWPVAEVFAEIRNAFAVFI